MLVDFTIGGKGYLWDKYPVGRRASPRSPQPDGLRQVKKDKNSLTGKYLSGKLEIETPKKRRKGNGKYLEIIGGGDV